MIDTYLQDHQGSKDRQANKDHQAHLGQVCTIKWYITLQNFVVLLSSLQLSKTTMHCNVSWRDKWR